MTKPENKSKQVLQDYKVYGIVDSLLSLCVRIASADNKTKDAIVDELETAITIFDAKKYGIDVQTFWNLIDDFKAIAEGVESDDDPVMKDEPAFLDAEEVPGLDH